MTVIAQDLVEGLTRDEAKILAYFAGGETFDDVAQHAGVSKAEVIRVVEDIATNNRSYAKTLALAWQRKANPGLIGSAPAPTPAAPKPSPPKATADVIADLLNRAIASEVPRLVRQADKIQDLVDQLEAQLAEHERGRQLRDEAERLEQRLAAIRAELKGAAPTPIWPAVDNKRVRAWAAANGVECPSRGRIPADVLAAYESKENRS